jgi:Amt family ammonium transporter
MDLLRASDGPWICRVLIGAPRAVPWRELMGPHLSGPASEGVIATETALWARVNGVFRAAFLLFSWTVASTVSGAIIERSGAFWPLAGRART